MEAAITKEVLQVFRPYKDYMTYKEAVEYMGRSESYLNSRLKLYCVAPNAEGFYSKSDLDRIKTAQRKII